MAALADSDLLSVVASILTDAAVEPNDRRKLNALLILTRFLAASMLSSSTSSSSLSSFWIYMTSLDCRYAREGIESVQ